MISLLCPTTFKPLLLMRAPPQLLLLRALLDPWHLQRLAVQLGWCLNGFGSGGQRREKQQQWPVLLSLLLLGMWNQQQASQPGARVQQGRLGVPRRAHPRARSASGLLLLLGSQSQVLPRVSSGGALSVLRSVLLQLLVGVWMRRACCCHGVARVLRLVLRLLLLGRVLLQLLWLLRQVRVLRSVLQQLLWLVQVLRLVLLLLVVVVRVWKWQHPAPLNACVHALTQPPLPLLLLRLPCSVCQTLTWKQQMCCWG